MATKAISVKEHTILLVFFVRLRCRDNSYRARLYACCPSLEDERKSSAIGSMRFSGNRLTARSVAYAPWLVGQDQLQTAGIGAPKGFRLTDLYRVGGLNAMSLSVGNQAKTGAVPDTLLQTLGVMRNVYRSMAYAEKRLSELAELNDLDPRLRREAQHLRGAMREVNSEVIFRLSMMGTTIAELLKEAKMGEPVYTKPFGEAQPSQGRARNARNRLEIVEPAQR